MADQKGANALTALVLEVLDRPGMSLRRLSEISVDPDTGYRISQTWLHDIAHDLVKRAPEPKFLRGLAAATGLPLVRIQQAAASQFLGYTATELSSLPEDARVIVGHLAGMDPSELPQVRAVVEALLAKAEESSGKRDV